MTIIQRDGKWGVVDGSTVTWFGYPWAAKSYACYLKSKKAEAEVALAA